MRTSESASGDYLPPRFENPEHVGASRQDRSRGVELGVPIPSRPSFFRYIQMKPSFVFPRYTNHAQRVWTFSAETVLERFFSPENDRNPTSEASPGIYYGLRSSIQLGAFLLDQHEIRLADPKHQDRRTGDVNGRIGTDKDADDESGGKSVD